MKREHLFTAALGFLLLALIILKPAYGWKLRSFLAPPVPAKFSDSGVLALENQKLKAELAELQAVKDQLPKKPEGYVRALVYSRYPLNFKQEFLINVGARENIVQGKAVAFGGVLVGRIRRVFADTSIVETAFDESFQLAVKIGPRGVSALLKGGSSPTLTLIPLTAAVARGDAVYSTAPDLPHGIAVGNAGDVRVSEDGFFNEAAVNFPYDIGEMNAVFVEQ